MTTLEIKCRTLTPLWTGGVDQRSDRLHETGLIGSLRWWYEALVRGLGGYACDPTSDNPNTRCSFDSKAYEKAKAEGRSDAEAIQGGLKTVCPVCYLFGCTGWARLFQLRAVDVPSTSLHFCTTLKMNQGWLKRVFGGEQQNISAIRVPYGDLRFLFILRRYDADYAKSQFALVLQIAAGYGGVGARLQHGFGQVSLGLPSEMQVGIADGIKQLASMLQSRKLRSSGPAVDTPFDFMNFVTLTYRVPGNALSDFVNTNLIVGQKPQSANYLPCVFDLRYKGRDKWGMRQWLKGKGWKESNQVNCLDELDLLLGPRSQWGPKGQEMKVDEDLRTASRVFFGMPYCVDDKDEYILRVWAFWPLELKHKLSSPEELGDLCKEYIEHVTGAAPTSAALGKDILNLKT